MGKNLKKLISVPERVSSTREYLHVIHKYVFVIHNKGSLPEGSVSKECQEEEECTDRSTDMGDEFKIE